MVTENKNVEVEETERKSRSGVVWRAIIKNALYWIIGIAVLWFIINYIIN